MRIAFFGATSQIAKDLICSFSANTKDDLFLYARSLDSLAEWVNEKEIRNLRELANLESLINTSNLDVIVNFIGSGNPVKTQELGAEILEATLRYDTLVIEYLKKHPNCRYIFLSSGAALGSEFDEPANDHSIAKFRLNALTAQDWYGLAKAHAECRHRAYSHLRIVDLRVFNYFSASQDLTARFFISDILRCVRDATKLKVNPARMVRDYITPGDFYLLIRSVIYSEPINISFDCYTKAPIEKMEMLDAMSKLFGLDYEIDGEFREINATGTKRNYYSLSRRAKQIGYVPQFNSLEGILSESKKIFPHFA